MLEPAQSPFLVAGRKGAIGRKTMLCYYEFCPHQEFLIERSSVIICHIVVILRSSHTTQNKHWAIKINQTSS